MPNAIKKERPNQQPRPEDYFCEPPEKTMRPLQFLAPKNLVEEFENALQFFKIKDRSTFLRGQMRYLIALKQKKVRNS
jgi:hypothetical protein